MKRSSNLADPRKSTGRLQAWARKRAGLYSQPLLRVLVIRATVMVVRFIAILLVAVLLPLSINVPSVMACPTTECCGANCSPSAPVSQVNCCKAPMAPDRAVSQTQDAHHFDSIATMPVAGVIIAISHLRNTVVARGYPPPDRPASLALLCSRQI